MLTQTATKPDERRLSIDPQYKAKVKRLQKDDYRAKALLAAMSDECGPRSIDTKEVGLVNLALAVKDARVLPRKLHAYAVKLTAGAFFMTPRQVQKIVADSH